VQRQMGRHDAGISQLMRTHGLTQTTMDRMVRGCRSGPRPRDYEAARRQKPRAGQRTRAQKPRTGQRVKRQKRPAGQLEPRHQRLERAQASEPSIEPYLAFLTALLDQAIRDVGSRSHDCRRAAWHWLRAHPDCVEICEWLELDHARVIEVLERRGAGAA
jgi:hypothetical protein